MSGSTRSPAWSGIDTGQRPGDFGQVRGRGGAQGERALRAGGVGVRSPRRYAVDGPRRRRGRDVEMPSKGRRRDAELRSRPARASGTARSATRRLYTSSSSTRWTRSRDDAGVSPETRRASATASSTSSWPRWTASSRRRTQRPRVDLRGSSAKAERRPQTSIVGEGAGAPSADKAFVGPGGGLHEPPRAHRRGAPATGAPRGARQSGIETCWSWLCYGFHDDMISMPTLQKLSNTVFVSSSSLVALAGTAPGPAPRRRGAARHRADPHAQDARERRAIRGRGAVRSPRGSLLLMHRGAGRGGSARETRGASGSSTTSTAASRPRRTSTPARRSRAS